MSFNSSTLDLQISFTLGQVLVLTLAITHIYSIVLVIPIDRYNAALADIGNQFTDPGLRAPLTVLALHQMDSRN